MKRLVILYDGTWNTLLIPDETTNVVRVGQGVKEEATDGTKQIVYYNSGVGSGGFWDQLFGGLFGAGLKSNVQRGLTFLAFNFNDGTGANNAGESAMQIPDEIYIFGFSRGAYTARALAGVLGAIGGIPKVSEFGEVEKLWAHYRKSKRRREKSKEKIEQLVYKVPGKIVKCVAVWDTVGSYGIPAGMGLTGLARWLTSWTRNFRDNEIGDQIEYGFHAMAIDEHRRAFSATAWVPWSEPRRDKDTGKPLVHPYVEQVWFPGAHANVGGGYARAGLSDQALIWMVTRVEEKTGLEFDDEYLSTHFWPCSGCSSYRSNKGWWLSSILPFVRTIPKVTPDPSDPNGVAMPAADERRPIVDGRLHWSVKERLGRRSLVDQSRYAKYEPKNVMRVKEHAVFTHPSKRETDLIQLCYANKDNKRRQKCALQCSLDPPTTGGWWERWRERRRLKRIKTMRKDWEGLIAGQP
jgi:uncharacterized protein (DUF2235 family)